MVLPCQHARAVDYAVGRYFRVYPMRPVHGPANHSGRKTGPQAGGDGAIRCYPAFWYLSYNAVYLFKKTFLLFTGGRNMFQARCRLGRPGHRVKISISPAQQKRNLLGLKKCNGEL